MNNPSLFPTDQRGVALPMAMLALLILSILVIGFSVLSATEPTVANNQLMVTQARALAEAIAQEAFHNVAYFPGTFATLRAAVK